MSPYLVLTIRFSSASVFTRMVDRRGRHRDVEASAPGIIRHAGGHSVYVREGVAPALWDGLGLVVWVG